MTLRDGMKKRMLGALLESEASSKLTGIIAQVEHELLEAAKPIDDALELGYVDRVPDVEDRADALKTLLEAVATDNMERVWCVEILPEIVDDPKRAEQYVGMESDEWQAQIERWADAYREQGATGTDRALARHHVNDVFGCEFDVFEDRVVGFSRGEEAERLFAANFRAVREVLDAAAEEVNDGGN